MSTTNYGSTPATNVTFRISLLLGGTITAATERLGGGRCTVSGDTAVCTRDRLEFNQASEFDIAVTAPDRGDGRPFMTRVEVTEQEAEFDPRQRHHHQRADDPPVRRHERRR